MYVFNILNIKMDETLFLNDIHECSCLIHKNHIVLNKLTSWQLHIFSLNVNHMYFILKHHK
jgi:hypothetical protein